MQSQLVNTVPAACGNTPAHAVAQPSQQYEVRLATRAEREAVVKLRQENRLHSGRAPGRRRSCRHDLHGRNRSELPDEVPVFPQGT
jgi:ribosome assembly protein YihI (activator of Der GTPase)